MTNYAYDTVNFLTQISHQQRSSSTIIAQLDYTRDSIGNITKMTSTKGDFAFVYDNNNQLINSTHPEDIASAFTYDSLGNRITDQLGNFNYDNKKQRLLEDWKYLFAYDNNGNLSSKILKADNSKVTHFIHNSENQLTNIREYNGTTVTQETKYFYDAVGRRIRKEHLDYANSAHSFERKFQYDNQEILFELDGENSLLSTFTHSGLRTDDVLAVDKAGTSYFYLKDHLGTVNDIVDGSGNLVQHYVYSPFGKIVAIKDKNGGDVTDVPLVENFYTFTGREYDKESGLYYYRARYYDSETGRFIQSDPHPGAISYPLTHINKYSYAGNNSQNRTDPSGMSFLGGFFSGKGGYLTDVIVAVAVVAIIVCSGCTAAGAMLAVASAAGGAVVASGAMALFQGGSFAENFSKNFHTSFRIAAMFLAGSALAASASGGGVASAGGNGLQGYVASNNAVGTPGGLTVGSSAFYSGNGGEVAADAGNATIAQHEFGHTVQFVGLSALSGLAGTGRGGQWGAYLGLGALGMSPYGTWWESNASSVGSATY